VFDGRGLQRAGRVESADRQGVTVRLAGDAPAAAEPSVSLTLVQSLLKGHALDEIVRDAVMLGVSAIVPLVAARTSVVPPAARLAELAARWRRIAIASAKQCGRAVVPDVAEPCGLDACLSALPSGPRYLLAEPALAGPAASAVIRAMASAPVPSSAALMVGPEGGWTDREAGAAAAAGAVLLTLGRRTLRAERAAVVAITALQCAWGDLDP
jgi:16S rRNA (uracil1498-N3)-methyltransferase